VKGDGPEAPPAIRTTRRLAVAIVALLVLLGATLAAPFWQFLPFLAQTVTYPWQLLLLAGVWLAWLAGGAGRALLLSLPAAERPSAGPLLISGLLTLTLLGSYSYLNPTPVESPAPDAPLAIFGDGEIALLDARVTLLPEPSNAISVTVHWQALRPLERDYTVFVHVIDPNGQLQGQQDTMPQDNKLPTSRWRPGQVVADRYRVALKPGAPSGGGYRYALGLYEWQTGQRLRTATDDKVMVNER
jgi:hypothetical protein